MTDTPKSHDGHRPGAGRKAKSEEEKMKRYMIRFEAETLERIKVKACQIGLTVSEFIRRAIMAKL